MQAALIFPIQNILRPRLFELGLTKFSISKTRSLFSASTLEFFHYKKSYLHDFNKTAPSNFSISKKLTSVALISQPPRKSPFQKILPPWLFLASPLEFLHFKKSYLRGSFQPAPSNFYISKNFTSVALKTQPPRKSPFQKILRPWVFLASPHEFLHFKKFYLRGSYNPAPSKISISKNLTSKALYSQPHRIFTF